MFCHADRPAFVERMFAAPRLKIKKYQYGQVAAGETKHENCIYLFLCIIFEYGRNSAS
jgi:hypothetical protein